MKICQRTRSATQAKSRLTINFNLSAYYLQRNIKWNWIMRANSACTNFSKAFSISIESISLLLSSKKKTEEHLLQSSRFT